MKEKGSGIILLNKLQLPEIKTRTLRRRRLLNIIARNLGKKVILLCAGAGYGKTTLLAHFFSENEIPVVYYHLERTDADPVVFFSYLIAGIRRHSPHFGNKIRRLQNLFNDPQRYTEIIAGTFLNEIVENVKEDIYIVLEDYHALQPSNQIDRIIDYVCNHMPANLHFIITSRAKLDISFLSMVTRDEYSELGIDHLKFTKDEIRRLFKRVYSISLKRKDLEWVEKYSEGWPVSLRLMLQSTNYLEGIRASDHTRMVMSTYLQSQASLFNYFAQEIFYQEKPRVRNFLLDCSVFEWLSAGLCAAVTGRKNAARLLSDLTKRNAFIVSIPEHGYHFHNLFRDFLLSKMTDMTRRRRLYIRAADYLAQKNKNDECLQYYAKANAYKKMIRVIDRIGAEFIAQGRSAALSSYIEGIPGRFRDQDPNLLLIYAQTLILAGSLEIARLNCLKAYRILRQKPGARRKHADILYALGGIYNTLGKRRSAMRYYKRALYFCPRNASLTRAAILNSLGSLHNMIGGRHLTKAVTYFDEALTIAQKSGFKEIEASILNNWAWSEWKMGNLDEAYAKLSAVMPILQKHFSPGCGAGFYNAARYSIMLGYNEKAKEVLDLGLQTCTPFNDLWSLATIWHGYAALYLETGDLEKARQFIDKSLEVYQRLGVERLIEAAKTEMCRIQIAKGDYIDAEKNISSIWARKKVRDDADSIPVYLTQAELYMEQNRLRKAEEVLQTALRLSTRYGEVFQRFSAAIELARLHHLRQDSARAAEALRDALQIARHKGYEYVVLKVLKREEWMLHMVREEDIERDYVMGLVKRSRLAIHWIQANVFGVPSINIDDQPISDNVWKTVKAKKLLFYLLLRRGERISGDLLVEKLWPKASAGKGSDSLRKAVQHIREVTKSHLGRSAELVRLQKGVYDIAPSISIWLDTEEFEGLCADAARSSSDKAREQLCKRAIELYGEGIAAGWYDEWVEDLRPYYRGLYENCLHQLAGVYLHQAAYSDAESVTARLLKLNFLNERYHRLYMEILGKMGRYKEIENDFKEMVKRLKEELQGEPSKETKDLYRSLIRTDSED